MGILCFPKLILVAFTLAVVFPVSSLSQNIVCNQTDLLPGLSVCLPYFEAGNTTEPGSDCCEPLAFVLDSDPTCMCLIGPLGGQLNLSLDETRALQVAALCDLQVPESVWTCLEPSVSVPSSAPLGTGTPIAGSDGDVGSLGVGTVASPSLIFAAGVLVEPIWAMLAL